MCMSGISQAQLLKYKEKAPHFSDRSTQTMLYKRFYIAIVLYRLVHEMPLNTISKDMVIERGQSQQIQKDCGKIILYIKQLFDYYLYYFVLFTQLES